MSLSQLEMELINIGCWVNDKIKYHLKSNKTTRKQLNFEEVWDCDLGYNIGHEKNKKRPVLVISNNKINQSGKVVVLCITDAKGKINVHELPQENSWYLLYSDTIDDDKMYKSQRQIPKNQRQYSFLDKDSVIQCEEIRAVSKSRFDYNKGVLGIIYNDDIKIIKRKLAKSFNIFKEEL